MPSPGTVNICGPTGSPVMAPFSGSLLLRFSLIGSRVGCGLTGSFDDSPGLTWSGTVTGLTVLVSGGVAGVSGVRISGVAGWETEVVVSTVEGVSGGRGSGVAGWETEVVVS